MSGRRVIMGAGVLAAAATLVAGATASSQATNAGGGYKVVGTWGKIGTGNGQFATTHNGIAVDKAGTVYIADTDNNRVQVLSKAGAFVRKWGTSGGGNGQFAGAEDIAVAPDGTVWVADRGNLRVQAFSSGGAFRMAIATPSEAASGVAVDADGNVFVSVEGGSKGGYRKFSENGEAQGGLNGAGNYRADDIEVSPDGSIYLLTSATQSDDDRVRHYSADGKPLASWKLTRGDGTRGIAVDLDCNVWAGDAAQGGITKYSPSGKRLATTGSITGGYVAKDTAVGPTGDVFVIRQSAGILRLAEDKSKPATANIPGKLTAAGRVVKIAYTLSGVACPAVVGATATLTGTGISGKAAGLKLKAGAKNTITMKLSKAASGKATFKIVLKTNGRPTTETRSVTVGLK
jgi:sugar lactone lactonase YvrE